MTDTWVNVHEEAADQLVFDTIGDEYIGMYTGSEEIAPDEDSPEDTFTQLRFRDDDGAKVVNAGFELKKAFSKIEPHTRVRITLVKFVDVGQPSPMKSYRVDVAG